MDDKKREILPPEELAPIITEVLASGGTFPFYPGGRSMLPTIRPGEDEVLLSSPKQLKVGDIIFYRRESGVFVLHRIVKIKKDGSLVLRGDGQFYNEEGVLPSQVIAVVAEYRKGERTVRRGSGAESRHFLYLRARYGARRLIGGIKHRLRGGKKK